MSLSVWAEDNDGDIVEYPDRLRVASLEVTINAEECSAGSSEIILDDSTGDFYVRGNKPMYFIESAAVGDGYFGIIGPFWTERRVVSRGSERTGSGRVWSITCRDLNSLLTYRVQKGTDAEREEEDHLVRLDWLINTAEVIGGHGDHGFTIEDTSFIFDDGDFTMSESDYTGQYSDGVINDLMQQSGANCYLFNSPLEDEPIRVGIWYGRTERTEFASLHKISNVLADISPEYVSNFEGVTPQYETGYVFAPSLDASLERDPSRQLTGVMVQFDGDYVYASNPITYPTLTRRDMTFEGGLVKTAGAALARANRYLNDLSEEDDAITCAVVVPDWLVHAFMPGHRVQFKNSYMPGYEDDYVWMRAARVTVRQIMGEDGEAIGKYELGLDLRAETPPGPPLPPAPGPVPCADDTPGLEAQAFYPLGPHVPPNGNAGVPVAPGVLQYARAGISPIFEPDPTLSYTNSWHFPAYGAGGAGTIDAAGRNAGNSLRIVCVSQGTITVEAFFTGTVTGTWRLFHMDGDIEIEDDSGTGIPGPVTIPDDGECYHILVLENWNGTSGGFWFQSANWDPVLE